MLQHLQFSQKRSTDNGYVQVLLIFARKHSSHYILINRDAKKHLPRPKVGDFCTRAMEDGFKDACYALCQNEKPVPRIAQACRAAAIELPRPTVRKWCEHGYRQGYGGTIEGLKNYFQDSPPVGDGVGASTEQSAVQEAAREEEEKSHPISDKEPDHGNHHIELKPDETIAKTIQITLDDETKDLHVLEGQSAEEAVAEFCQRHMPDEISACVRQLLPLVLERMEE